MLEQIPRASFVLCVRVVRGYFRNTALFPSQGNAAEGIILFTICKCEDVIFLLYIPVFPESTDMGM